VYLLDLKIRRGPEDWRCCCWWEDKSVLFSPVYVYQSNLTGNRSRMKYTSHSIGDSWILSRNSTHDACKMSNYQTFASNVKPLKLYTGDYNSINNQNYAPEKEKIVLKLQVMFSHGHECRPNIMWRTIRC
jgi:hypothetical protein